MSLPPCTIYREPPLSGAENMRRDELLLEQAVAGQEESTVRIYRWEVPTVTVGYFQKSLLNPGAPSIPMEGLDPRLIACPRVARLSGGGAILHDQELTYSCTLPVNHPFRSNPLNLYEIIHRAVIDLLKDCGVRAMLREDYDRTSSGTVDRAAEPFLCFLRSDPNDIVVDGVKILGSAQRRRKGCILQHGSLLLKASKLTPELTGLVDLAPSADLQQLTERLPVTVAAAVAENWRTADWNQNL